MQCITIASCKLLWAHCIQIFRGASSRCALECILERIAFPHIASESSCTQKRRVLHWNALPHSAGAHPQSPQCALECISSQCNQKCRGASPQYALECIAHHSATEGTARPPRASQNILEHPPQLLLHHSSYNRISFFISIQNILKYPHPWSIWNILHTCWCTILCLVLIRVVTGHHTGWFLLLVPKSFLCVGVQTNQVPFVC